jgi:hypothetical protein
LCMGAEYTGVPETLAGREQARYGAPGHSTPAR